MDDPAEHTDQIRQRWREALHQRGLKSTQPRLAVLEVMDLASRPLTHKEIADQLVERCLDKATIFRILADLCEFKFVRRFDVGDHTWRYEFSRACDVAHTHLVCNHCGSVTCLDNMPLPAAVAKLSEADDKHLVSDVLLRGLCSICRTTEAHAAD